ncbi:MAG: hypothetical protein QG635_186 [Bacteroidota bacterium]|nr:hypothetical protein [Bacteroidota bacterium]
MKKFILLLTIGFIVLLSSYEAKGACEVCLLPKICVSLGTSCNGTSIQFMICYECPEPQGIEPRGPINIDILDMQYDPEEISDDDAWDCAYNTILNNLHTLCGTQPCNGAASMVNITKPVCARYEYNHITKILQISADWAACGDKRCETQYWWCYCTCEPGTCENHPPCPIPHPYFGKTNQTPNPLIIGIGYCDVIPIGPGTDYDYDPLTEPFDSWIIECKSDECY